MQHPDWVRVHSSLFPPIPPSSPSSVVVVSDENSMDGKARRISSRLSSLPKKEYAQSQSDGDDVEPCVHNELVVKKEKVGTRRMGCGLQAKRVPRAVNIAINVTATEASGRHPVKLRVKTTVKRSRRLSSSSDSDISSSGVSDPAPCVLHQTNTAFTLGTVFVASDFNQARDLLLARFKSFHSGGHITCKNSRFDYVYASCCRCGDLSLKTNARAAVQLKGKTWIVTTCNNGAEQPCKGISMVAVPVEAPNDAEDQQPQPEAECKCCYDNVTAYITCDSNHVTCIDCMERSIGIQCLTSFHEHFLKHRRVVCPTCPTSSMWHLGEEEIKKRCLCTHIFICILMMHCLSSGCPKQVLNTSNTRNVRHTLRTR